MKSFHYLNKLSQANQIILIRNLTQTKPKSNINQQSVCQFRILDQKWSCHTSKVDQYKEMLCFLGEAFVRWWLLVEGLRFIIAENVVSIKTEHINCGRQAEASRETRDQRAEARGHSTLILIPLTDFPICLCLPPSEWIFIHSFIQANTHWLSCYRSHPFLPSHHHYYQHLMTFRPFDSLTKWLKYFA